MIAVQLERIKHKLDFAKKNDPDLRVFGACEHRYEFNPPVTAVQVAQFENLHRIKLPEEYVAFITTIGNGGPGHYGGAGPFYGIYPLGEFKYMIGCNGLLSSPGIISSQLTEAIWKKHTSLFQSDQFEESVEYDRKYNELFQGLLPIGTQGCNFQTMLSLHAPDKGRVVNIDQDLQMPLFALQHTFLDWYEAWLDKLKGLNPSNSQMAGK
jgi:SMI1 / KNR4 family (SUKH-1)